MYKYMLVLTTVFALWAAPAMAGSIAYVKDGNVYLSTDDGSRQFQVTTTGGYSDVTQADDGTMIALYGIRLHKLDRMGTVLADFDTPVSDSRPAPSKTFYGPFDPAISPDGQKLAYTYYYMTQSQDPTCYPPECVTTINEGGTGYSHTDRQTGWDEDGFRKHSGWRFPFWADNETTVLSDPTHLPNADVVVDRVGERDGSGFLAKNWFTDDVDGNPGLSGGDITRDKAKMAFATGENDSTLSFYAVAKFPTTFTDGEADPSERPDVCYRYSGPNGGKFGTPTFSPDGTQAAFTEGDGVHVVTVPSFANGCTLDGASPNTRLLIAGATQPDWGPAAVPADRPVPTEPAKPAGGSSAGGSGGQAGAGGGTAQPATSPALTVTAARLRAALARGLAVKLTGAKAGKATVVAKVKGRVVAKATGTVAADGTLSLKLKFAKAAKRSLKRMAKVKVVVTGAGASRTVTLRK